MPTHSNRKNDTQYTVCDGNMCNAQGRKVLHKHGYAAVISAKILIRAIKLIKTHKPLYFSIHLSQKCKKIKFTRAQK